MNLEIAPTPCAHIWTVTSSRPQQHIYYDTAYEGMVQTETGKLECTAVCGGCETFKTFLAKAAA